MYNTGNGVYLPSITHPGGCALVLLSLERDCQFEAVYSFWFRKTRFLSYTRMLYNINQIHSMAVINLLNALQKNCCRYSKEASF